MNNLPSIPNEIWKKEIYPYLSIQDILNCQEVCKHFRIISGHENWKILLKQDPAAAATYEAYVTKIARLSFIHLGYVRHIHYRTSNSQSFDQEQGPNLIDANQTEIVFIEKKNELRRINWKEGRVSFKTPNVNPKSIFLEDRLYVCTENQIWDVEALKNNSALPFDAVSIHNSTVATITGNSTLRVSHLLTPSDPPLLGTECGAIQRVSIHCSFVATGSANGTIQIWNLRKKRILSSFNATDSSATSAIKAISLNHDRVAFLSNRSIFVYNWLQKKLLRKIDENEVGLLEGNKLVLQQEILAFVAKNPFPTVTIMDWKTGTMLRSISHSSILDFNLRDNVLSVATPNRAHLYHFREERNFTELAEDLFRLGLEKADHQLAKLPDGLFALLIGFINPLIAVTSEKIVCSTTTTLLSAATSDLITGESAGSMLGTITATATTLLFSTVLIATAGAKHVFGARDRVARETASMGVGILLGGAAAALTLPESTGTTLGVSITMLTGSLLILASLLQSAGDK